VAVWKPSAAVINTRKYNGTSWESIENIGGSKTSSVDGSDIAVGIDNAGNILTAWIYYDENMFTASSYYDGTTWTPLGDQNTESANSLRFDMDQGSGKGTLVWRDSINDGNNYFGMGLPFTSGGWGLPEAIKPVDDDNVQDINVAINSLGHAIAVISVSDDVEEHGVLFTRYYDGANWQSLQTIFPDDHSFARITLDDNDLSHLAYVDWSDSDNLVLKVVTLTAGISNEDALTFFTGDNFQNVEISANASGDVSLVWQNGLTEIKRAKHPIGDDWVISLSTIKGVQPRIVRLADDLEVLTFLRYGGNTTLFSFYPETSALEAPTNFHGSLFLDRFSSQIYYINRLTWEASPSETVVGYKLYKGDALLAVILADETFLYNDYKINPSSAVTYSTMAYSDSDNESELALLTLPPSA
jgi:hypothetical protein